MGRKKKSLIEKSPFKLRHRKLADGRLSLFLDRSVDGGHEYEFLHLYLMPETSAKARRQNAQTLRKAEEILCVLFVFFFFLFLCFVLFC